MPIKVELYSENNDFQHIEVLKNNREKRQKNKEFFIEGVKPIEQLIANNWNITAFVYSKERKLSNWATEILEKSTAEKHFELPESLMQKLSDKEETSELIALAKMKEDNLTRIEIKKNLLIVVFDRPASPGNLGTIIRTCDAFKADGIVITGHAVDLYDSKTIRSSVGTQFSIPIIRIQPPIDLIPWFEKIREELGELQIIGTSAKGTTQITEQDFTKPTILLIGNETTGLCAQYKELADTLIKIPIHGSASSLNVASAASIALYEIHRQRNNN